MDMIRTPWTSGQDLATPVWRAAPGPHHGRDTRAVHVRVQQAHPSPGTAQGHGQVGGDRGLAHAPFRWPRRSCSARRGDTPTPPSARRSPGRSSSRQPDRRPAGGHRLAGRRFHLLLDGAGRVVSSMVKETRPSETSRLLRTQRDDVPMQIRVLNRLQRVEHVISCEHHRSLVSCRPDCGVQEGKPGPVLPAPPQPPLPHASGDPSSRLLSESRFRCPSRAPAPAWRSKRLASRQAVLLDGCSDRLPPCPRSAGSDRKETPLWDRARPSSGARPETARIAAPPPGHGSQRSAAAGSVQGSPGPGPAGLHGQHPRRQEPAGPSLTP